MRALYVLWRNTEGDEEVLKVDFSLGSARVRMVRGQAPQGQRRGDGRRASGGASGYHRAVPLSAVN